MLAKTIDNIEANKGDDEFYQVLYQTQNSFILSWPAHGKSITVDKETLKVVEHKLFEGGDNAELLED